MHYSKHKPGKVKKEVKEQICYSLHRYVDLQLRENVKNDYHQAEMRSKAKFGSNWSYDRLI